MEDTVAWHYKKTGVFSVNRAYRLARYLTTEAPAASSNEPNGERKILQNIWSASVPKKVSIFSWRLALDNLPTQKNK
jgi:hypothetical protein